MPRRPGNLPIRTGDRIVFREGEDEETLTAKRNNGQKITATGKLKKVLMTLAQRGEKATLEIEVTTKDGEGRELLTDG